MAKTGLVLGVDIGGTNTALGLIDREGICHGADSMPTRGDQPVQEFFRRLNERAQGLLGAVGEGFELLGIGMGAPNANYARCTIENPPNLSWDYVDLRAEWSPYLRVPVAATNDANAAALGEMRFGAARGLKDFIVITLGTGLGSGIVVDGRMVYGSTGLAGELGHLIVDPEGRLCGCGRRGCLETYASATGILRTVSELLEGGSRATELRDIPRGELTSRRVFEAARRGDEVALEAFRITGEILGRKLADAVVFSSPEAIILFGGLAGAGELLFGPTRRAMEANLFPVFRGTVRLLPSGIQGNAAILGAAALGWEALAQGAQTSRGEGQA